jgi:two-component system, OmpR family, phosphate regulon response regulator PhoB
MARILITDDEPLVRNLVRATLDFGEHELLEAHDGPAALALAKAAPPEIVILDLGLPGELSGLDVLARLRATNATARFIVLTGSGGEHEKAARAAGANDFLTKPFSPLQLIERIEVALAATVS